MARIRTIKPDFFTSSDVVNLPPLARLLFVALWCEADREGRLRWRPENYKTRYLPADDCSTVELCALLVTRGLVIPYGDGLAYIPTFKTHQRVPHREAQSTLPPPSGAVQLQGSCSAVAVQLQGECTEGAVQLQGNDTATARGKGKEGKGKEGNIKAKALKTFARSASRNVRNVDETPGFAQFWMLYPRKEAKARALKAWTTQQCEGMAERIVSDIRERLRANWLGKEPEFIPHPATYINGARWHDALIYPEPPKPDTGRIGAAADRLRARLAQHDAGLHTAGEVIELAADDWGVPP